jgi:hypothetical protein
MPLWISNYQDQRAHAEKQLILGWCLQRNASIDHSAHQINRYSLYSLRYLAKNQIESGV